MLDHQCIARAAGHGGGSLFVFQLTKLGID